jgi:poly(hydroxyalkanoate) granule-associated protein
MVKKLQKMAAKHKLGTAASLLDSQLAQTVKDSAQQIWLAGLGAFAKAQGEGGKVFDTLIKEGMTLHRRTQSAAEEKLGGVAGRMSAMAGQVGNQANAQWDKLESIFEERTARALGRLGVPSAQDLADLNARLDALAASVAALGGSRAAAKPSRKAPPVKAAAKEAADAAPKAVSRRAAAKPAVQRDASALAKSAAKTATKTAAKTAAKSAAKPAVKRSRSPGGAAAKPTISSGS